MSAPAAHSAGTPPSTWAPFRVGIFRGLWLAALASNVGSWMHLVAAQWLMTSLTTSAALVALLSTASAIPTFLLALPSGALADVVDRRKLILVTQAWQLLVAAALAVLSLADLTTPTVLLVGTGALGVGAVLGLPAFTAVTPEVVERELLPAAISLNSVSSTLAQAVGPAIGGLLVASLGSGGVFAINAASFLAVLIVVGAWRRPPRADALPPEHVGAAVRTGARYVAFAPEFRGVLVRCVAFVAGYAGLPALLAVYTRDQLREDASAYGLLLGALGLGGVLGALLLPRLRRRASSDQVAAGATVGYAAAIAVTARLHSFPVVVVLLLGAGVAGVIGIASLNIAAQSVLPDWIRGRGLAVLQLTFQGTFALGAAAWGTLAQHTSIPTAMTTAAIVLAASTSLALRYRLATAEGVHPTLAAEPEAFVPVSAQPEDGPIQLSVHYVIPPAHRDAFVDELPALRAMRRRDGAISWAVFADLADTDRHTETFTVSSWAEHLRIAQRLTVSDRELLDRLAALHVGEAPPTSSAAISTNAHRRPAPDA